MCITVPRVAFVALQNRPFKGNTAALLGNGLNRLLCSEKEAKYQRIIMWTAVLQKKLINTVFSYDAININVMFMT